MQKSVLIERRLRVIYVVW